MARILIIDDDPQLRESIRLTLEAGGHEVVEAADGVEGLRAQDTNPADLVLCDVIMPRLDGLATIRTLRGRHPGTPIIAISGGAPSVPGDPLVTARHLGAAIVLHKPLDLSPAFLNEVVAKVLRRSPAK
jgi:two-component system response regulator MprA